MTEAIKDIEGLEPDAVSEVPEAAQGQEDAPGAEQVSVKAGFLTTDGDAPADMPDMPDTPDIPARAEDYDISVNDALGAVDPDLNRRLHDAGFSNAQAQLVYDLAGEILEPMMADLNQAAQRASDRATLVNEFGGARNWKELAPRIEKWGRANLPEAAFDIMCQTADGVRTLHRLMAGGDEARLAGGDGGSGPENVRSDIRRKMNDPRYWRDRDPDIIAEVQADFARLSRQ
ncbi:MULTISPECIES: capsid assembly protein [Thalassospira]|uniref:Uncharacterized protein n=1 Tax=Thalassospira aquimaris TaxID=3037796 RepID=A0ABT6G7R3_9PROT|nr:MULTISPECIES: hypothetical protein [Thalassospira]MDG4718089.1 hypothetical protein [Thalassospira sp. FZY0004]